jgi:hypothetical protein
MNVSLYLLSLAVALEPHGIGDTVELRGNSAGERIAVTVVQVTDPAIGASEFEQPSTGNRFVGVQIRLTNTGTTDFEDAPDNGSRLLDPSGQSYGSTVLSVSAGQSFGGSVHIAPGDSRLGYLVFDVPAASVADRFQFTLDSGFGPETAVWTLGGSSTSSDPVTVVERYYGAINDHDYAAAWALGGKTFSPNLADFTGGFASTRHDTLNITAVNGDTVQFTLDAEQIDGSHRYYSGTYTVRGGIIVSANVFQR